MNYERSNILDYNKTELTHYFTRHNYPAYRADQLFKGIYSSGWDRFSQFTMLSKSLRAELTDRFHLRHFKLIEKTQSKNDGTIKFLWALSDKKRIESVIIFEGKRITFCISSQAGCALDCKFCATGKMGFLRNLTTGEIVEQVMLMKTHTPQPPTNIVFMGMGEPMLNYDAVMNASEIFSDPEGLCFSRKKITISTSGIVKNIRRMADEDRPYSLAISLNATNQDLREKIMPISKKYPLKELLEAVKYYQRQTNKRVTFEYILIKGINDALSDARELVKLTHDIACKINIIPCNSDDPAYQPSTEESIMQFDRFVNEANRTITIRQHKGRDIKAACGQLYAAHANNT